MQKGRRFADRLGKNEYSYNNWISEFLTEPTFVQTLSARFGPNLQAESSFGASLEYTKLSDHRGHKEPGFTQLRAHHIILLCIYYLLLNFYPPQLPVDAPNVRFKSGLQSRALSTGMDGSWHSSVSPDSAAPSSHAAWITSTFTGISAPNAGWLLDSFWGNFHVWRSQIFGIMTSHFTSIVR